MQNQSRSTLPRSHRRIVLLGITAVIIFATAVRSGETPFLKKPYIQNVTKTSGVVMWETPAPAEYVVTWSQNGKEIGRKSGKAPEKIGEITIDHLKPDTKYTYVVKIAGTERGGTFQSFPEKTIPFRFLAYTDTQNTYRDSIPLHKKCAEIFSKLKPRLAIHSGDLTESGSNYKHWGKGYFEPLEGFAENVPIFSSPGNHEYNHCDSTNGGCASWYLKFLSLPGNELWYSFDFSDVHFISLNSELFHYPTDGNLGNEQLKWLENDLKSSKAKWKVAYFHRSPFISGGHGSSIACRRKFVPLFDKYGVDIVFNGHDHCYTRSIPLKNGKRNPQGTVYMTTGISRNRGTGPGFHLVYASGSTSFATVDVSADHMNILIRDEFLNEIDRLVLTKSDAYFRKAKTLSRSTDNKKRLEAVRDLAALDNGTSEAALRALLKDPEKEVSDAALLALAETGQLSTSELFAASGNPVFRTKANPKDWAPAKLTTCRIYEKPLKEQMTLAKTLLKQGGGARKVFAIKLLANVATSEAIKLLANLAKDDNKYIRRETAKCLGKIFDPYSDSYGKDMGMECFLTEHLAAFPGRVQAPGEIYAMLLSLMEDKDGGVAETAQASFFRMGVRLQFHHKAALGCIERLLKLSSSTDKQTRKQAIDCIRRLPCSDRTDKIFLKSLSDNEEIVVKAAVLALVYQAEQRGYLVKGSEQLLIKALGKLSYGPRHKAMKLLRKLTDQNFRGNKQKWQKWATDNR